MADFDPAFDVVISHEGTALYSNPKTGEVSKFGITAAFWNTLDPTCDHAITIPALDIATAAVIYREFWNKHPFGSLADQTVASKLFDAAVNMGIVQAVKLFQRAINQLPQPPQKVLVADGVLGPLTISAANSCNAALLIETMSEQQEDFYKDLAAAKPEHAGDLAGWLKRAAWPEET